MHASWNSISSPRDPLSSGISWTSPSRSPVVTRRPSSHTTTPPPGIPPTATAVVRPRHEGDDHGALQPEPGLELVDERAAPPAVRWPPQAAIHRRRPIEVARGRRHAHVRPAARHQGRPGPTSRATAPRPQPHPDGRPAGVGSDGRAPRGEFVLGRAQARGLILGAPATAGRLLSGAPGRRGPARTGSGGGATRSRRES